MADIHLKPFEDFEHQHGKASTTTLCEGEVHLTIAGTTTPLIIGETVVVPPNTPHVMHNIGPRAAVVRCGHEP